MYTYNHPFPVVTVPPVIPQTVWNLYGIPNNFMILNPKYSQSVVEFEQQYYNPSDLSLFFDEMGIPGSETPVTVIGPNDPTSPGFESSLDIQWIMAMSPGIPTVFWSNAANGTDEVDDILTWALALGNTPNPPLVHSISYGMPASLVDTFLGAGYLARSDIEFQKLGTQGLTLVIADGDSGAGDLGDAPYMFPQCNTLNPDWPSQSPYVAAVGSTYMTPLAHSICYHPHSAGGIDCTVGQPMGEVGVSLNNGLFWTTGGGFANTQKMPDYQAAFVANYIAGTTLPPYNTFNVSGRAYPDYSAVGHNLLTAVGGYFYPVDGTSASAPIFAGIVSLLNEIRAKHGMPPMGFINPLFYNIASRNPSAFNDVVLGQNKCSDYTFDGIPALCCPQAYIAETGWDAVTGLGSPNFNILKDEVLSP
jgi:tripeptidyl-peptidase-1